MSSYMNWSSEEDEILITFVRNHEPIYNIKHKEYRKAQKKQIWWREIGEILKKTDSDCYKRWNYVRDYYIRRRGKAGTSGEAARKRSVLLSFLDNLPSTQQSSNTNVDAVDENPGDSNSSSVIMENTNDDSEGTQNPEYISIKMENTSDKEEEETQSTTQERVEVVLCDNNEKKDGVVKSNMKRKYNEDEELTADQDSTQNVLDETDLFFRSIAKIVKKLPRYEQVHLRMQIGSLVGNAELRHLE